jgi:hypothetical protein
MPSDRERYSEAIKRCRIMARAASSSGYQQLWTTVAESYRCLYDNEMRTQTDRSESAQGIGRARDKEPDHAPQA